jgi:2-oxoglutarate/2-oxoacid ferredoxin oxidoreductase subunit alpha
LRAGHAVAQIHLRHLNPLPKNLGELLRQFDTLLVPELNTGQLATLLRDRLCLPVRQLNKVSGQPFTVAEIEHALAAHLTAIRQEAAR